MMTDEELEALAQRAESGAWEDGKVAQADATALLAEVRRLRTPSAPTAASTRGTLKVVDGELLTDVLGVIKLAGLRLRDSVHPKRDRVAFNTAMGALAVAISEVVAGTPPPAGDSRLSTAHLDCLESRLAESLRDGVLSGKEAYACLELGMVN